MEDRIIVVGNSTHLLSARVYESHVVRTEGVMTTRKLANIEIYLDFLSDEKNNTFDEYFEVSKIT